MQTAQPRIKVVIADDHVLVRMGIRTILEHLGDYEVVGEYADGNETLQAIESLRPDIALLDIDMPGMSGIEVIARLRAAGLPTKLLCLSALDSPTAVQSALSAGADGYLLKDFALDQLAEAMTAIRQGKIWLSPSIVALIGTLDEAAQLSMRQREVLRLVAQGHTNKEIARQLEISIKTVEFHRAKLMERLGLKDVASLALYAARIGVVPAIRELD